MTLPTFLGLGAMRSGSTWLDRLLRRHPRIYLPTQFKEVHFFDRHYQRGLEWYGTFFPPENRASAYDHIGEITPKYLYDPEVPDRIKTHLPNARFLIILRNPADRAYSHYRQLVHHQGASLAFRDQLAEIPEIVDRGFYARQIKHYFARFPRDRFCVLIFEHAVRSPEATCRKLGDFLSIDSGAFDLEDGMANRPVNASSVPRFHRTYLAGKALACRLRSWRQGWLVRTAVGMGLREFFRDGRPVPPMDPATRRELLGRYEADIRELQALLGLDLSPWLSDTEPVAAGC
jgi:hypothetical protein